MSNVLKLLKLQLDSRYDILKVKSNKLLWSIIKYAVTLAVVYGVSAIAWLGAKYIGLALNVQLITVILLVTQVSTALFGVASIIENLYFNKDNELLIVYPVSPNEIFYSKLIFIYFREFLVNTAVVLPMLLSFGVATSMQFSFFAFSVLLMPILPLLPMSVALLLSVPAALAVTFFKKHQILSAITLLAVIAGLIALYSWVISFINGSFNVATQQVLTMLKANAFITLLGNNCLIFTFVAKSLYIPTQFYWILVYTAVAATLVVAISFFMKPFYFNLVLKSNEGSAPAKVKQGKYILRGAYASLFVKEIKTALRSPNYIFQYFTFTLLMPFIVVCYDRLLLQLVVNSTGEGMISGAHVLILCTLAMLSNISSATAISREGGAFVLLKTNPCSMFKITFAKVAFNAVFTLGGIVITGIICCFYQNAWEIMAGSLAVSFLSIGHICMCIDDDICNPLLSWYDSGEINKLSKNVVKAVVWGLIISFTIGFTMMLTATYGWVVWLMFNVVSLVFMIWRVLVLIVRISYRYNRVEI